MTTRSIKQTYEPGDRVTTPLGTGVIRSCKVCQRPEGQIRCRVKHEDYHDHDGDTFDLNVEDLRHTPGDH